ncbi:MAG: hypothetical protein LIP03_12130 [Bacteroidales bacterium]|nr:hypothetical protein [Bacteroidales bacterium]
MKFNKIVMALAAGAALLGTTSCLSNDSNNSLSYTSTFSRFFNVIFEDGNDTPTYQQGVGYEVTYNYTDMVADVQISGLTLPSGSLGTLTFNQVPWAIVNDWKRISLTNVTPSSSLIPPTFSTLNFYVYDRMVTSTTYYPCLNINYSIASSGYSIISFPAGLINYGETTVSCDDGSSFASSDSARPLYYITLYDGDSTLDLNKAENRMAKLVIEDFQLSSAMNAIDLQFTGIAFDIDKNGMVSLSLDEQVPSRVESSSSIVEIENYKVTNLRGTTNTANLMTLSFIVEVTDVDNGTVLTYNVMAVSTAPSL